MLYGDNSKCSYGVQVTDASGETHQYGKNTGQGGIIDFTGWKEIVIDLDSGHETWGGDKNGKIDYPITGIAFTIGQPTDKAKLLPAEGDLYFDALSVDSEKDADETLGCQVAVVSPDYCSDVKGDIRVTLAAPGFKSVTVKCWKQGDGFGVGFHRRPKSALDDQGNGSFVFPADHYPHGPITVRIGGENGAVKDNCYLQLYNKGGVSWNEGMPKDPPPAAKGMKLVFADDFDGPPLHFQHRPQGRLLRPQAAQRLAGLQRAYVLRPRFPEEPLCPGRFLSADQGQRQAAQLGLDFLPEERRQRHQGHGPVLLRVPVHRPQRHRHLAGLLAHDGLHDELQDSRATRRRAMSWTSSRPMAAKAPANRTRATAT